MTLHRLLASLGLLLVSLFAMAAAPASVGAGGDPVEVDIMSLTSIEWQQGDELPRWIRDLDGKEVIISGFMSSQFNGDKDELMIVADGCQCTGTPLPQHYVKVQLDEKTGYTGGELTFIGTMSIGEEYEDGFVNSLFRLDGKFF